MEHIGRNPSEDFREIQLDALKSDPSEINNLHKCPMIVIESLSYLIGQFDINDMKVVKIENIKLMIVKIITTISYIKE